MTKEDFLKLYRAPEEIPIWAKWIGIKMFAKGAFVGVLISCLFFYLIFYL